MRTYLLIILIIISGIANAQSKIVIKDSWVRPAAKHANSALYFSIHNEGETPDTLIGAKSKSADITEVHETFSRENNQMGMRSVKFIAIPAKSVVELKPGGFHVMLIDMKKDYKSGDFIKTVIQLKNAGKITIKSVVKDNEK
jgi:periplasmic copper chaperone A